MKLGRRKTVKAEIDTMTVAELEELLNDRMKAVLIENGRWQRNRIQRANIMAREALVDIKRGAQALQNRLMDEHKKAKKLART